MYENIQMFTKLSDFSLRYFNSKKILAQIVITLWLVAIFWCIDISNIRKRLMLFTLWTKDLFLCKIEISARYVH